MKKENVDTLDDEKGIRATPSREFTLEDFASVLDQMEGGPWAFPNFEEPLLLELSSTTYKLLADALLRAIGDTLTPEEYVAFRATEIEHIRPKLIAARLYECTDDLRYVHGYEKEVARLRAAYRKKLSRFLGNLCR